MQLSKWSGINRSFRLLMIVAVLLVLLAGQALATSPYPIIFVHGLFGNHTGWNNARNSLISEGMAEREIVAHFSLNADQNFNYSYLPGDTSFVAWSRYNLTPVIPHGNDRLFLVNFDRRGFPGGTGHGEDTYSNTMGIVKSGAALGNIIDRILSLPGQEADKVILIGHSMGGLAIREYLQRADENGNHRFWDDEVGHRVAMAATMATPHHGSMHFAYVPFEPNEIDENWLGVRSTEAARDLRTYHFTGLFSDQHPGVYLFGGPEGFASGYGFLEYDNKDVNCDGVEGGDVVGVSRVVSGSGLFTDNPEMPLPLNIPYRWVTSVSEMGPPGDGVVLLYSQWLHNGGLPVPGTSDTVRVNTPHVPVHDDLRAVHRGLDEPDEAVFAYEIPVDLASDDWVSGRITYAPNYNPNLPTVADVDQYRFTAFSTADATLRMSDFDWSNTWAIEIRNLATNQLIIPPVTAQNNPGQLDVTFPVVVGEDYLVTIRARAQQSIGNGYFFAVDAAFIDPSIDASFASIGDDSLPDSPVFVHAYPNPFNAATTVTISLQQSGRMTAAVYDVLGREVIELASGQFAAGRHQFTFNGSDLVSGVYFLRVSGSAGFVEVQKLVLMK
jgi:pimeloyl-ACP methyl ester carboxylesterase